MRYILLAFLLLDCAKFHRLGEVILDQALEELIRSIVLCPIHKKLENVRAERSKYAWHCTNDMTPIECTRILAARSFMKDSVITAAIKI